MAGVQTSTLAIAVARAGGLGSLPCAMLEPPGLRAELQAFSQAFSTDARAPLNVNFFCHQPPVPDAQRVSAWHAALAPYYAEAGLDVGAIRPGSGRTPFNRDTADVLDDFRPSVVSFHFGLPTPDLLQRVRAWGALILA